MNKFFKNFATLITIVAGIAAIIGVYLQYSKENPKIEIKSITVDKLTDLPKVDGLNAKFYYKDSLVNSLWKLNYQITNSGNEIIIGQGNNKNIIKNGLVFSLPKSYKILELVAKNRDFPFKHSIKDSIINLDFLQWKPEEGFELTIYAEQLINQDLPNLFLNEREIIGGEVLYTTLYDNIEETKSLFEYLPRTIQSILRWVGYAIFGLVLTIMPIVWFLDLIKFIKHKKWKRSNYWMYKEWIEELISNGSLAIHYEPQKLPPEYWDEYPYLKPIFPDNEFGNLTVGVIMFLIVSMIPLLIMIKI